MIAGERRVAQYWLLVVLLVSVAPQALSIPGWLLALLLFTLLWRLPLIEARWPPPPAAVRWLLFSVGLGGLWLNYQSLIGPQAGVAFLILCMSIKLLELQQPRDISVLLLFSCFLLASHFLLNSSLWLSLYTLLALLLLISGLLSLQMPATWSPRRTLSTALGLLLQALPLMLVLYVLFPRLPPLWKLPAGASSARTGLSADMAPGDFVHLSTSSELVFRVQFQGRPPRPSQLYWRALVLTNFDGRDWRQPAGAVAFAERLPAPSARTSAVYDYRIILQPSGQHWLYALAWPLSYDADLRMSPAYTLWSPVLPVQGRSYSVRSDLQATVAATLAQDSRRQDLQLPAGNQQARAQARAWRAQARDDGAYVQRILQWFHQAHFIYSLDPPPLVGDQIDDFLFHSRRGFCEHYASAFVFLMRASGLPARVVIGYQGGQPDLEPGFWDVRQMDAHAWAEVWLPGRGWVREDPTAAIAPERIEKGEAALLARQGGYPELGSPWLGAQLLRLHGHVQAWIDELNFRWQRDVLSYDVRRQQDLLLRYLGSRDVLREALLMMGLCVLILLLFFAASWSRQRRRVPAVDRYYRAYSLRMARLGLARQPGEGVHDYAARVARRWPERAATAREVAHLYSLLRYQPGDQAQARRLARLRRLSRL